MNMPDIPLLAVLKERMAWLNARQGLIAQNVANADVPDYTARDLKPLDFAEVLKNSTAGSARAMSLSDPNHIPLPGQNGSAFEETDSADTDALHSGNGVGVEEEMMKVADTQAQYQAAANLYAKSMQLMRTAIDRQGS
ncbi:MAG TPA: flagellar basal body rod protein FlgB [Rhizomicrobium sp.]|jgi:flagellar basal-body rod protein FlgB